MVVVVFQCFDVQHTKDMAARLQGSDLPCDEAIPAIEHMGNLLVRRRLQRLLYAYTETGPLHKGREAMQNEFIYNQGHNASPLDGKPCQLWSHVLNSTTG